MRTASNAKAGGATPGKNNAAPVDRHLDPAAVVATWPPLTPAQMETVRAALAGGARGR